MVGNVEPVSASVSKSQSVPVPAQDIAKTEKEAAFLARSQALDLAGAFTNDGYKIRDGFWSFILTHGNPHILIVQLFAKNEYWFSGAAPHSGKRIKLEFFDEKGIPVEIKTYGGDGTVAAGLVPQMSGAYFIRASITEGKPVPFCLVYSYK